MQEEPPLRCKISPHFCCVVFPSPPRLELEDASGWYWVCWPPVQSVVHHAQFWPVVLTLHWQPWVRLAYITITKDSRIVQSIWISIWHDCKLYNSNSRDDPKWENCVSLYESQNNVSVLTCDVDVDDGDDGDECKNRADRVKAGTKSALQYIDAFNSNNIKVLSILHCTEKKDLLIFLKTIVPVIFMYSLFPDSKSKLFIHILPFGKCWPPVQCIHILISCVSLHHTGYLYNVIDQSNVSKSDFTIKMLKLCRQSNLKLGPTQHFMQD